MINASVHRTNSKNNAREAVRSSCGRDETLRSCKSNVGRSVHRTCGDSTTKRNGSYTRKGNIMSVYVPKMHFTVKDETEEVTLNMVANSNSE